MIEIKNRFTGSVIYSSNCETLREAVIEFLKKEKDNLSGDNLSGADLSGADLSGAELYVDNLSGADLSGANLSRANLYGANLYAANLSGADLSGADLSRAYLSRANLYGADLSAANLSGADLSGADLSRANLYGANLSGADLSGAKDGSVCRMDFGGWSICIRSDKTTIGCKCQENKLWLKWTPTSKEICAMDVNASAWWALHGPAVKAAIRVVRAKAKQEGK